MKIKILGSGSNYDFDKDVMRGHSDPQIEEYKTGGKSKRKPHSLLISHGGKNIMLGLGSGGVDLGPDVGGVTENQIDALVFDQLNPNNIQSFKSFIQRSPNTKVYMPPFNKGEGNIEESTLNDVLLSYASKSNNKLNYVKSFSLGGILFKSSPTITSNMSLGAAWRVEGPIKCLWSPDFYKLLAPDHALKNIDLAIMDGSCLKKDLKQILSGGAPLGHQSIVSTLKMLKQRGITHSLFTNIGRVKLHHEGLRNFVKNCSWFQLDEGAPLQSDIANEDGATMVVPDTIGLQASLGNIEPQTHFRVYDQKTANRLLQKNHPKYILIRKCDMVKDYEPLNMVWAEPGDPDGRHVASVVLGAPTQISNSFAKELIAKGDAVDIDHHLSSDSGDEVNGLTRYCFKTLSRNRVPKPYPLPDEPQGIQSDISWKPDTLQEPKKFASMEDAAIGSIDLNDIIKYLEY